MRLFFQSARYFRTSRLCGNDPIVVVGKSGKFKRFVVVQYVARMVIVLKYARFRNHNLSFE